MFSAPTMQSICVPALFSAAPAATHRHVKRIHCSDNAREREKENGTHSTHSYCTSTLLYGVGDDNKQAYLVGGTFQFIKKSPTLVSQLIKYWHCPGPLLKFVGAAELE
jgi:hypothetical protein